MSKPDSEAQFLNVSDLRIGMFVYLDLGWMKHPFALNSFKITSREQIDTIVKLGINRIRWSPEKSDLEPAQREPDSTAAQEVGAGVTAQEPASAETVAAEATAAATAATAAAARQQRRELLSQQHESLEACERQFTSAARNYRQIIDSALSRPEVARTQTLQVIGDMVDKMLDQEESAIRLLSENAGEKASLHALNVTVISLLLGRALGLDSAALNELGMGALLHDLGKLKLPERLRWCDAHFSNAERNLYLEHVAHGVEIGQALQLPAGALAIIAQHHESADGHGYPRQLAGSKICEGARIVSLVNHYDNLCNPANPALAITPHEALSLIFAQMKKQFDAQVLTLFIRMMGVYPPGSVVELNDGRYALVVSVNSARPLKPNVIIFEARVPRNEALVEDLEQNRTLGIRRSLKPLQLPRAAFDYLSPRQRMCYFFERARNTEQDDPA